MILRRNLPAVVAKARAGNAVRAADVHRRDRVPSWVAPRIGIHAEQLDELDVEPGLLAHLAHRARLGGLADLDEAAGNRPTRRRILALDEHDAAARELDDHVGGGARSWW